MGRSRRKNRALRRQIREADQLQAEIPPAPPSEYVEFPQLSVEVVHLDGVEHFLQDTFYLMRSIQSRGRHTYSVCSSKYLTRQHVQSSMTSYMIWGHVDAQSLDEAKTLARAFLCTQ